MIVFPQNTFYIYFNKSIYFSARVIGVILDTSQTIIERKKLLSLVLQSCKAFNVKNMVCETPHGVFMVDINDSDIGRLLLETGKYGYQEMLQWFELLNIKKGTNIFIDIGANIGTTAIPLALDNKFTSIFSFEPDPYNFSLLEYNIKRNNLNGIITPQNYAVGDNNGHISFELSPRNFGDHRVRYDQLSGGIYNEHEREIIEVPINTLDSFISHNNIELDKIALIKSDTQGNEGHVFLGAQEILKEKKIPWIIEFWPYGLARAQTQAQEFLQVLKNSFSLFVEIKKSGGVYHNSIDRIDCLFEIYKNDTWCNVILIP